MDGDTRDTELLVDEAVERVGRWLEAGDTSVSRRHRAPTRRLARMGRDRPGTAFAMRFVDRVIRPEDPAVAAAQLASLVGEAELPSFLSPVDRLLVRLGARTSDELAARLGSLGIQRMRVVGTCRDELRVAANDAGVHLADDPVTAEGRIELLHYLREQAVSRTTHRYGNVL